jgi:putative tryptophan/tyrosine transport system substrate-binding protein
MRRREFLRVLGGAAAAWPTAAHAQKPGKIARIGQISTGNPRSASIYQAFEQGLRELGYVEGQNLAI